MNHRTTLGLIFSIFSVQVSVADKPAKPEAEPVTAAPTIPGNEILLFDINQDSTGWPILSAGKNITNSIGYDSQPRFSKDGSTLYYTHAVVTDSTTQMDIYQYDLNSGQTSAYMTTAESEYSPTPEPNGEGLSVVQVDSAGDQYLVLLDNQAEKSKQATRYSDLKQVGYFNWTIGGHLWSFILNDRSGGDLYVQGKDKVANKLSTNVGRSFITDAKRQHIYYVDKNTQPWRIKSRNNTTTDAQDIMTLPLGVEDFTLDSHGRFWAGRDNTLFVSIDQKRWYIAHEFNDPTLHQITRITTNPTADKIAIVFAEKPNTE